MLYRPLWLYGDASHLCISQRAIDSVDSTWLCTGLFDARFMYLSARPSRGALSRRRAPEACRSSAPPPALLAPATVAQVIAATSRLAPAGVQLESPPADRLLAAGTRALQPASSEKGRSKHWAARHFRGRFAPLSPTGAIHHYPLLRVSGPGDAGGGGGGSPGVLHLVVSGP